MSGPKSIYTQRYRSGIGCLAILLALISPRLALFVIWVFTDMLGRAFDAWLVPLIGFFLLPWTTLAYTLMWSSGPNGVGGFEWFIVIVAFLVDLASLSGGARERARR